jgi:hypothetical protein
MELSVQDGTTMSGLGCLGFRAKIAKSHFLAEKDKRALAKLNPRKRMLFSCLKAIPSWTGSSGSGTWVRQGALREQRENGANAT